MTSRFFIISVALFILTGCSGKLFFYPVKGLPEDQASTSVISAKASGTVRSGNLSFTLPSGESFEGSWSPIQKGLVDNELSPVWDSVYGSGFYVAHVLGSYEHGKGLAQGNKGTVVKFEFHRDSEKGAAWQGVGRDSNNVVYKISI